MKFTRFAQSCVLVETKGKKILVDPGEIQFSEDVMEKWKGVNFIFVTHKHSDHIHEPAIRKLVEGGSAFYTTKEVANAYPSLSPHIVKEGDLIELDDVKIEVVKAVHGYIPLLKGGNEILENVGYIIDDGEKRVYFPSDTICFKNDYKCNVSFVPVCNHGLVMGPFEAALFAKETGASLVVPFHYNNPTFPADLELVKKEFEKQGLNFKFLEIGESIEV